MRHLYHLTKGDQLFEEDGVDHTAEGWFDHPEKAGLVPVTDPNGPTKWVAGPKAAEVAKPAPKPEPEPTPVAVIEPEPTWAVIPPTWEDLHWTQQVKLASEIKGEPVEGKPAAVEIITAELARRAG